MINQLKNKNDILVGERDFDKRKNEKIKLELESVKLELSDYKNKKLMEM